MEGKEDYGKIVGNKTFEKYAGSATDRWTEAIICLKAKPSEDSQQKINNHLNHITQVIDEGKTLLEKYEAEETNFRIDFNVCRNQIERLEALKEVVENKREDNWLETLVEKLPYKSDGHLWVSCNGDCPYFGCNCFEDYCGTCEKLVKDTDKGVDCTTCGTWFHLSCCRACSDEQYDKYNRKRKEFDWDCKQCQDESLNNPIEGKKPPKYGPIEGVNLGDTWKTRKECAKAGVHGMFLRGIHFGKEGAYAICLNGGYEDNIDGGDVIIYTGEAFPVVGMDNLQIRPGGRDDSRDHGSSQSRDQERLLRRGNKALRQSIPSGNEVRVIRGPKPKTKWVPESGYRYDGLYRVLDHVYTLGRNGFFVHKFLLKRSDQETPDTLQKLLEFASDCTSENTIMEKFNAMKTGDQNGGNQSAKRQRSDSDSLPETSKERRT